MTMIETKDLTFAYPAEEGKRSEPALRGVSLGIEKGSFVVVLGQNGSGNSTCAKHMNAVLLPSGGAVYVEGMDTHNQAMLLEIRRRVGMVFQNPDNQIVANVVEEDVAFAPENLGVPPQEIRRRVDDALAAVLAVCIVASRVPMKSLTRGLKPVYVIVAFTAVMNIFFTGGTAVGEGWLLGHITYEGLTAAIYMVLRIVMLIMGTFLLTYTTSPIALTDGLENLLGPLKKLHLPVHELAMMMSIALRFIPTLIEETDKIMSAQKARGADFESGNIFQRAKALVPILVPLFISAFRRADELATAMECRCYHGGEGRTALHVLRYQAADFVVLAAFVALAAGLIVLKHMGI